MMISTLYDLKQKYFIITGGKGLMGIQHAEAIRNANGQPVLLDISKKSFLVFLQNEVAQ